MTTKAKTPSRLRLEILELAKEMRANDTLDEADFRKINHIDDDEGRTGHHQLSCFRYPARTAGVGKIAQRRIVFGEVIHDPVQVLGV
ncbi:hypothetical protein DA102_036030 [Sinorhizobium meliloti]|nr:hypothetical protein DA102_036030 [Sinorhizobium meliloti]